MQRVMLITTIAFMVAGILGHVRAAEPEAFQIGAVKIWAIADNTGDRDMGVFLAEPEVIRQYVSGGTSPSAVMCFVLRGPDGNVLLDTGNGNPPDNARPSLLLDGLKAIGLEPADIDAVVITHMHGDHIGGLAWEGKQAFPNATIHVGRLEHDFWLNDESLKEFPNRKANFDKAKEMMALYDGQVETFEFGTEFMPGLTAVDARGHTPGHAAILLESEEAKLLCIGDLLHSAALQFARPDINSSYDMLPTATKMTRRDILSTAARENLPIAGMHLPFPGIGRVEEAAPDGFAYTPGL